MDHCLLPLFARPLFRHHGRLRHFFLNRCEGRAPVVSPANLSPSTAGLIRRMAMKRQVVVITGASAGVGRATVRAFARQGADIGLISRGIDGLEAARREVEDAGGRALVVPTDVAYADRVEAAAALIEHTLGPIDVWVNNAMVSVF